MPTNPPEDWPQISASLFYDDAPAALEWLTKAFGFEIRICVEGPPGKIAHAELVFGSGMVMVGSTGDDAHGASAAARKSPRSLGGANTQFLYVFVDDLDAHCARARAAGATILEEPSDRDYGDRVYAAVDPEGHQWWFGQRVRDPEPEGD